VLGPIVRAQIVEQRAHWCARRVVGVARDELVDLAALLRELGHPTRMAILQHVDAVGEASPRAFTGSHAASLATVAHHFRALARAGLIQLVRREPRRGAVEHFYALSDRGRAAVAWLAAAPR
jgi:DNA-binding transcriptional ArsR family regulator